MLCDVDRFKAYNDRYGHPAGDDVLRRISAAISSGLRGGDAAYRYGGEESLAVLPEQTAEAAVSIAARLRRAVQDLAIAHDANPPEGLVTISSGVATLTPSSDTDGPLKEAGAALYEAKEAGGNAVRARDGEKNRAARNPADAGPQLES